MAVTVKAPGGTPAAKPAAPKLTLSQRAAKDPALLARALKDPGLRSKLDTSLVPLAQQRQRALNQRLNAPVTPGSTMTNRDLSHAAKNAVTVQYGPADTQASQLQQNVPGYYKDYLASLATHAANTRAVNDAAVTQDQQLQQGVRGLDQAASSQMQAQATQDAANRGTTAADTTGTADQASQVRQAMIAALGTAQAGRGAAANTYADTLANVVGPGQQLGAQSAAGQKLLGIRQQEGAANQQYRSDTTASEAKNVLANQALGLNTQKADTAAQTAKATIDIKRGVDPVTGKPIVKPKTAADQKTQQQVDFFNTHGYYPPTGPPKAAVGAKGETPAAHAKRVADNTKFRAAVTTAAANARFLKSQQIKDPKTDKMRPLTDAEIGAVLRKQFKDADIASAGMDLVVRNGKLTAPSVAKLKARGVGVPKEWLAPTLTVRSHQRTVTSKPKTAPNGGVGVPVIGPALP